MNRFFCLISPICLAISCSRYQSNGLQGREEVRSSRNSQCHAPFEVLTAKLRGLEAQMLAGGGKFETGADGKIHLTGAKELKFHLYTGDYLLYSDALIHNFPTNPETPYFVARRAAVIERSDVSDFEPIGWKDCE